MIRFLISITVHFFVSCSFISTQKNEEEKIKWSSERKLLWSDFKGNPKVEKGSIEAETQCEINILNIKMEGNIPQIKIGAFFIKNKSWTNI